MTERIGGVWVHKSERLPAVNHSPYVTNPGMWSITVPVWDNVDDVSFAEACLVDHKEAMLGYNAKTNFEAGTWWDNMGQLRDVEWWLDIVPPPKGKL